MVPRPFLASLASRGTDHEQQEIAAGVAVPFEDALAFQFVSIYHMPILRNSHIISI